jgi:hypothetical protein
MKVLRESMKLERNNSLCYETEKKRSAANFSEINFLLGEIKNAEKY